MSNSNYAISLSGLQNTARAIDTVSNNIANANTVGYKAGEYVFADQFLKAVNPVDFARVGMGSQTLGVRRPNVQGTIVNSANPLDLAISGKGMFRLIAGTPTNSTNYPPMPGSTSTNRPAVDPAAVYYTRNGQFGVDKDGYIVNENGMYLTGYQPTGDGTGITDSFLLNYGLLKMPPANLPGRETSYSKITALLDSSGSAFTKTSGVEFDPTQNTFNNKTTQTVFDYEGNRRTLEVYYRRVTDSKVAITYDQKDLTYSPGIAAVPGEPGLTKVTINSKSIIRVDTKPEYSNSAAVAVPAGTVPSQVTLEQIVNAGDITAGMRVWVNGRDSGLAVGAGYVSGSQVVPLTGALAAGEGIPQGAGISFYPPYLGGSNTVAAGATGVPAGPTATSFNFGGATNRIADALKGYRVFANGVDTGAVVSSNTAYTAPGTGTITLDRALDESIANGATLEFRPVLDFTLIAPDGTNITATGSTNDLTGLGALTFASTIPAGAAAGATGFATAAANPPNGSLVGYKVFVNGVDIGRKVTSNTGVNVVLDKALDDVIAANANVEFKLDSTWKLTATASNVEVYASIDGRFYDKSDGTLDYPKSSLEGDLTPEVVGVLGYNPVSRLTFLGGKNIDSLIKDPVSGNPLFTTVTGLSAKVTGVGTGTTDLVFDLDLTDTTLQPAAFQIASSIQDGEPLSRLSNVTIDNGGRIVGVYGSGKQIYVGQVVLADFTAFEELIPVGKNAFAPSAASGTEASAYGVVLGRAGTGPFGEIKSQALESSNVDLANELVRLMIMQRSYSANSQGLRAVDSTLRDMLDIMR